MAAYFSSSTCIKRNSNKFTRFTVEAQGLKDQISLTLKGAQSSTVKGAQGCSKNKCKKKIYETVLMNCHCIMDI